MKTKSNQLLLVAGLCLALGVGLAVRGKSEMGESGYPDWMQAVALIGKDPDGNLILIGVDPDGYLTIPIKGENPDGDLVTIAVDPDGQLFTIVKGTDGNILAVDSDGYMTAILKGDYLGALRTIGLDDEGRISGYLVDDEDQWNQILKVGNAEQAARLGSPISWDRRGQTQLVNDFKHGMGGYATVTDGAGAAVALDPSYWQSGGYSVKLTGGSDGANRYAGFVGHLGLPPSDTVGFALRWSSVATPDYLRLQLVVYKGGTAYFGYLRYDFDNTRLQYMDSLGAYQNLAVQEIYVQPYVFNSLKLVIDSNTSKYVRALLNNTAYDLSAYSLLTSASGVKGEVSFSPVVYSHDGDNDIVYIDYLAITTEEP